MRLRSAVALTLLAACAFTPVAPVGAVEGPARKVPVVGEDKRIGGLSGLAVLDGGARFVAVSDRGALVEGTFLRDGSALREARVTRVTELRGTTGGRLDGNKVETDAEGLAITRDGALNISFEYVHRVAKYRDPSRALPYPALLRGLGMEDNGGLEALAVDSRDRLVAVPETGPRGTDLPVLRFEDGQWRKIGLLHPSDGFAPVGADFGPDGRLYLLERAVGAFGFRSRIRRLDFRETGGVFDTAVIWQSGTGLGNLEGLSIWSDSDGAVHATMVADDNFSALLYGGMVTLTLAKSAGTM
ncbi:hypothetical protein OB2597_14048 [Pseudooceanicola batsensis HTCC2597]|uniref:Phytase-like domain-containing protein n=1 Tax=Pseudooceanicola batsensis (strain ATCC BAA-863 / DSM 15984 / KCTC 12145 / HTCC2597) TaxID=252305 RepID=A3TYN8_PSEBH|nr:esterase-like activity of phytase family protein [Pseudooceanicola batsensis]EAQ03272.1 hypothetical protein OB2597_14048 [Pseudooceanicola batsensis HTCC2597]